MDLPSWAMLSTDNILNNFYFTDSEQRHTAAQACRVWQTFQYRDPKNISVELGLMTMNDEDLCRWATSKPVPEPERAPLSWGFRLLVTPRQPMTEEERNIGGAQNVFDLESSFDLSYFGIKRKTLETVMRGLELPERFLAIIHNRREESVLSCAGNWEHERSQKWMKYVLRTEKSLPSDLALTVSWNEYPTIVTAFLHGCTPEEVTRIDAWLGKAKTALKHPLLPAVILTEIQLERHGRIYREYYSRYNDLFDDIGSKSKELQTNDAGSHESNKLGIARWLTKIFGMYQKHRNFHRLLKSFHRILKSLVEMSDKHPKSPEDFDIMARLREISNQYEDLVGQSTIIADGTSLLLTTVWSLISQRDSQLAQQANFLSQRIADSSRTIAKASGRDGSAMRALAVITMTFLPSTAMAAICSMPFFDWERYPSSAYVRRSVWIFCVLSGVLTSTVLYVWRFWHLRDIWHREVRHRKQEDHRGNEPVTAPLKYPLSDQILLQGHDKAWENPTGNIEQRKPSSTSSPDSER